MYNRYIPQPDGSYQRRRMEEPHRQQTPPAPPPEPPCPTQQSDTQPCPPPQPQPPVCPQTGTGNFLRQLLPRDFDTGDLMVIILLLLIAGDCEKERSNALLTLALYFIM